MCIDNHVTITEDLSEKMTLPKDHPDPDFRLKILEKIAEYAFKQGSYHVATKKFTQAGNKTKVDIWCFVIILCYHRFIL